MLMMPITPLTHLFKDYLILPTSILLVQLGSIESLGYCKHSWDNCILHSRSWYQAFYSTSINSDNKAGSFLMNSKSSMLTLPNEITLQFDYHRGNNLPMIQPLLITVHLWAWPLKSFQVQMFLILGNYVIMGFNRSKLYYFQISIPKLLSLDAWSFIMFTKISCLALCSQHLL